MAIVFIHRGYSPYLEFSLRQARAADPGADLVLLGDRENDRFPFLRHVDTSQPPYPGAADAVARVYEHRSTNARPFELACFQRWFVLRAFMQAEGLTDALVLDSDVMLYAAEAEVLANRLRGKRLGLCWPREQGGYRWATSAHASYWTAEAAGAFCDFVLRSYTEPALTARYEAKWQHHLRTGQRGGVCDMTALHLFRETLDPAHVANMLTVEEGWAHDRNLNQAENEWPDEYATRGAHKAIHWEEGYPAGTNRRLGAAVRFQSLHLQGHAKALMPRFYRGAAFDGQAALRRALVWRFRARGMASAVAQPVRMLAERFRARR